MPEDGVLRPPSYAVDGLGGLEHSHRGPIVSLVPLVNASRINWGDSDRAFDREDSVNNDDEDNLGGQDFLAAADDTDSCQVVSVDETARMQIWVRAIF
jgi:hypothetical protein